MLRKTLRSCPKRICKFFCFPLDIRVPEVVKADAVQFGSSKNRFKGRFCPPLVERRARLRGEYQIVGIIPKRPRFDSGRSLHALLRLERIQHQGRGRECAALAVLGRDKRAVCPLLGLGKLLADGDSITAHTIPCKPQQLGKAAPGEQGRFDMLLYPMSCAYADAAAKKCCSDTRSLAAKKQYSRPCAGC